MCRLQIHQALWRIVILPGLRKEAPLFLPIPPGRIFRRLMVPEMGTSGRWVNPAITRPSCTRREAIDPPPSQEMGIADGDYDRKDKLKKKRAFCTHHRALKVRQLVEQGALEVPKRGGALQLASGKYPSCVENENVSGELSRFVPARRYFRRERGYDFLPGEVQFRDGKCPSVPTTGLY